MLRTKEPLHNGQGTAQAAKHRAAQADGRKDSTESIGMDGEPRVIIPPRRPNHTTTIPDAYHPVPRQPTPPPSPVTVP